MDQLSLIRKGLETIRPVDGGELLKFLRKSKASP